MGSAVYLATIYPKDQPLNTKFYIGATRDFKSRFYVHKQSFLIEDSKNKTSLSDYYWTLKKNNKEPMIKWSIIMKTRPPDHINDRCLLCLNERTQILRFVKKESLLNVRDELTSVCRHKDNLT